MRVLPSHQKHFDNRIYGSHHRNYMVWDLTNAGMMGSVVAIHMMCSAEVHWQSNADGWLLTCGASGP